MFVRILNTVNMMSIDKTKNQHGIDKQKRC